MRTKDRERLGVIRLLQAAIKQKEIDDRITLEDASIVTVVEKMIKQRRESVSQYKQGNRPELAAKESAEIAVLEDYMPAALNNDALDALIKAAITQHNATSIRDMGKVMNQLKEQVQGRANMADVSTKIKQLLDDA